MHETETTLTYGEENDWYELEYKFLIAINITT